MGLQMGLQMGLHFVKKSVDFRGGQMGVNTPYLRGFASLSGGGYLGQNSIVFQLFSRKSLQNRYLYIIKEATKEAALGRSIKTLIRFEEISLIQGKVGDSNECAQGI